MTSLRKMTKRELRRLLRRGLVRIERTGGNWRVKSSAQRRNCIVLLTPRKEILEPKRYVHGIALEQIQHNLVGIIPPHDIEPDAIWKIWKAYNALKLGKYNNGR